MIEPLADVIRMLLTKSTLTRRQVTLTEWAWRKRYLTHIVTQRKHVASDKVRRHTSLEPDQA